MKSPTHNIPLLAPVLAIASSLLVAGASQAMVRLPPATAPNPQSAEVQTKAYIGLSWTFGVKSALQTIFGLKAVSVDATNNVTGGELSVGVPVTKPSDLTFRLKYLQGTTTDQGELGVGYACAQNSVLWNAGYSAAYANASVDYLPGLGFSPSVALTTLGPLR